MSDVKGTAATPEEYKWEFMKGRLIDHSNEIKKLNKVIGDMQTTVKYHGNRHIDTRHNLGTLNTVSLDHDAKLNFLRREYVMFSWLKVSAAVNAALTLILSITVYFK